MTTIPTEFDTARIEWGLFMGACFVTLQSRNNSVGFIHIRAADDAPREQVTNLLAPLTGIDHLSADDLRAALPNGAQINWDNKVYTALGSIEIRGKGAGLRFWIVTNNPAGFLNSPSSEQLAEATAELTAVRNMVWPS